MSKIALISDIHSNLLALQAVLEDCAKQKVTKIFFLGDAIGYGPKPVECLDLLIKHCDLEYSLIGNHDFYVMSDDLDILASAAKAKNAIIYTKQLLFIELFKKKGISNKYIDWIMKLKSYFVFQNQLFVHGSPFDPMFEYISPHHSKGFSIFERFSHLCFSGHTHIPGVFTSKDLNWIYPKEIDFEYKISSHKAFINIGSVGQPRDEDPRACYGIFEKDVFTWRRIEYDVKGAANQIYEIPELDNFLGNRLLAGR